MEARHLYYEANAIIISLISLGHMLGARARQRSSKILKKLLDLTPPTACVVADEDEKNVPLADVQAGMLLRLTTSDRIPVDGEITQDEAWFDGAMLIGKLIPQQKGGGDSVHTGTVMQDGSMLFRASAVGSHTTLSRIVRMVHQAQSNKPEVDKLTDRISSVFVPVVVVTALVGAAIWYFFGPAPQIVCTLVVITTVLVIAYPCALDLATPMSAISGVDCAAEFEVLVRSADALQHVSTLDTVVFDKTGTLTEGKSQVVAIKTFGNTDEALAIRLAVTPEQGSSHPLARAILDKAGDVTLPQVNGFRTLRGLDVSDETDGRTLLLGNQALLNEQQVDTTEMEAEVTTQVSQGSIPVLLAIDCEAAALLAVRNPLYSGSVATLQCLHRNGHRLVMLTGDNPAMANAIAKEAGINEVIAGVLPDDKAEAIRRLQSQGHQVTMVGGGINDAPTLIQADVGITMDSGSDVAIETATITLMRHSLMGVADALSISRAALRNMKQSLISAFIYNSTGIPVAAGILWPFTGTLLNPVVAGTMMALSSITVVDNVNRLLHFKPRE